MDLWYRFGRVASDKKKGKRGAMSELRGERRAGEEETTLLFLSHKGRDSTFELNYKKR